jgi:lipopolysaccharide transport system ATP-binding protein
MARMSEVAHTGRTVLFVSHNLTAVQALCHRTIWLHEGVVAGDGETREVLSRYLRASSGFGSSTDREWPAGEGPSANGIELRRAAVYPVGGQSGDPIDVKTNFRIEFQFAAGASTASTHLGLQLVNEQGTLIFDIGPGVQPAPWTKGLHMFQCDIPAELFNDGAYRFGLTLYQDSEKALELPEILSLDILDSEVGRNGWFGKWPGLLRPRFSWKVSSAAAP